MPQARAWLADPGLRAALAGGTEEPAAPEAARLAAYLADAFGPTTAAVVHYGSHAQGADPGAGSAHDFFVIVDGYAAAYARLARRAGARFSPRAAAFLNRLLPPNVIAVRAPGGPEPVATKCAVLSLPDWTRACSPRARDHFVRARVFQRVRLAWSRDGEARAAVVAGLAEARAGTFAWGRAALPPAFDVETYCRVLLDTSYAAEIRPEAPERVTVLLDAQREALLGPYGALLDHLVRRGVLSGEGGLYRDLDPPGRLARLRIRAYFAFSKLRATVRWIKYVALYEDWLDYAVRKVERRSGVAIRLTRLERRWPLLFLWPRALLYLLTRPQRRR